MPAADPPPIAPSLYGGFGSGMPSAWPACHTCRKMDDPGACRPGRPCRREARGAPVTRGRMTLWELNRITPSAFATALGDIFEHSPWVAERASTARPFGSIAALHAAMLDVVDAAPREKRLALIRAHPELAGKAAIRGELTADSTMEQSGAGLSQCTADELVAPDGAQRGLQREIRLPVHPRGQGVRSRRNPARIRAAHPTRRGHRVRRGAGADRADHAVSPGRAAERVISARPQPARSVSPSAPNWR